MTFDQLVAQVEALNVPALEARISHNLPQAIHDGSSHEVASKTKSNTHTLDVFKVQVREFDDESSPIAQADIVFQWKYCPYCKEVRSQRLIGYHRAENQAYVREIISKGVRV